MDRAETIELIRRRKEPWDIIVIGGGATGVGCALDAASRGFDVLLLEQHDLGKGTSSRSTKLIHGGVRYLRQGNISLVRDALRERFLLLKNAPHVVHEQAFVIPCYSVWQKIFYGTGLKIYGFLAGKYGIGPSKILSSSEVATRMPNVKTKGLKGGVLYYDGQFDDTRLLIDMAVSAREHGVAVLNYARVTGFAFDDNRRITGVEFEDAENGETFSAKTRAVINATGAFCDTVRKLSDEAARPVLMYSQGIHLILDNQFLTSETALLIPKTSDGRVLFCIPWRGRLVVGTTDTPIETPRLEPQALSSEIDFILETIGEYLTFEPSRDDIKSVFAGVRPLIKPGAAARTSSISRGHDLFVDESGLVTITGGKWTTFRRMAEDAVDKAIGIATLPAVPCVTANIRIKPPEKEPITEKLHAEFAYTRGDIVRGARNEMARTVEDVLARRTRILFLDAQAALDLAPSVARIMAEELGQEDEWIEAQVRRFEETAKTYLCQ